MKHLTLAALAASIFFACNSSSPAPENAAQPAAATPAADMGYYQLVGDSVLIPAFDIRLEMSEKAAKTLQKQRETIIVDAMFAGQPLDTTSAEYREAGEILVAEDKREVPGEARAVKFDRVKFSKTIYDSLREKDILLLVNVYSGRRSSEDNLLDCGIISENMSTAQGKIFALKCKLIGE